MKKVLILGTIAVIILTLGSCAPGVYEIQGYNFRVDSRSVRFDGPVVAITQDGCVVDIMIEKISTQPTSSNNLSGEVKEGTIILKSSKILTISAVKIEFQILTEDAVENLEFEAVGEFPLLFTGYSSNGRGSVTLNTGTYTILSAPPAAPSRNQSAHTEGWNVVRKDGKVQLQRESEVIYFPSFFQPRRATTWGALKK